MYYVCRSHGFLFAVGVNTFQCSLAAKAGVHLEHIHSRHSSRDTLVELCYIRSCEALAGSCGEALFSTATLETVLHAAPPSN